MIDVLDAAYDEGIRTFMCTTHDRIARGLRPRPRRPRALRGLRRSIPCMPYAHKYANAVTEHGMLGALERFLPDEGCFDAAMRGGTSLASKDIEGMMTLLIDAEMKMFEGLRTPVDLPPERRRRPAARAGVRRGLRGSSPTTSRERYGAEPGFITMNLPRCSTRSTRSASRTRSSARTSTRSASGCAAASRPTSEALRERRVPGDRDVGLRLRRDPAARGDRVGLRAARTSSRSSSAPRAPRNIRSTRELVARYWDQPALSDTLLVASNGGHLKQLHRLHGRLDGRRGPFRWVDLRHAAEPLAARRRGGRLRALRRRPRPGQRAPQRAPRATASCAARRRGAGQHRLGDRAALLRARPAARPALPLHRERRADARPVDDRPA